MTNPTPLLAGKAFRVAPGQTGQAVASFWKFWVEGGELYAMNRDNGSTKISVHASGQIHMRAEKRELQLLAPGVPLPGSNWNHVLEIRYLIARDRLKPISRKLKKKEKAFLVDVPDDHVLLLNLMVANPGSTTSSGVPFDGARALWRSSFADGLNVLLVGRVTRMDEDNRNHVERFRGADGPKITLSATPTSPYLEFAHVFWSPTGSNVALIVPAGDDSIRKLERRGGEEVAESEVPITIDAGCVKSGSPPNLRERIRNRTGEQ